MTSDTNQEFVQIINTAIIKSKEKKIDSKFEDRLLQACKSPEVKALTVAITHLAESQKISNDQAAMRIVETVRELDTVWDDYIMLEGITNLKGELMGKPQVP